VFKLFCDYTILQQFKKKLEASQMFVGLTQTKNQKPITTTSTTTILSNTNNKVQKYTYKIGTHIILYTTTTTTTTYSLKQK
jgi:hypothetical protein